MKIYTKTGDNGTTSLLGGARVSKGHLRIESYGTIDELNSYMGLLTDQEVLKGKYDELIQIQNTLFVIGSSLARDSKKSKIKIPELSEENVIVLESLID